MSDISDHKQPPPVTRFVIWYRNSLRPVLDAYKFLILLTGWLLVFIIGYIGFTELSPDESVPSLLALTAQIFMSPASNLQVSSSLFLNCARAGAVLLLYISIIALVAHWFYFQFELLWLKLFTRNHIIVCGLGEVGSVITRNIVATGSAPLVVIEKDPKNEEIEWCRSRGITVITGSATDRRVLEQAHIAGARALYIATGSDQINATVIATIHEILPERKDTLHCYVHIIDPNFTNLLRAPQMALSGTRSISLDFFNIFQIANFCVLDKESGLFPVQSPPKDRHILIIGLGRMGEGLITEIGKRWMQTYGKEPAEKITITAIDRDAARKVAILETRYPRLSSYCEIIPWTIDINSPEFYRGEYLHHEEKKGISAIFLCLSNESLNFSTGLYLNQRLQDSSIPIVIRTLQSTGLAHFFSRICHGNTEEYRNLHPFPLVSCACCIESLVGMNELIARSIHRNYTTMRTREGGSPDTDPAMKPWNALDAEYREASRSQAAHIKLALKQNGYSIVSRTDWDEPLVEFSAAELEEMAKMEHDRWRENRVRRGWKPGPRDLTNRTSPYLIPYEELDERTKEYDRAFIRLYPEILAMVDLSIRKDSV